MSLLRTIRRRESRILDAKGIGGVVTEMRFTWKRRSKKTGNLIRSMLFPGSAPDAECAAEREAIVERFRGLMAFFGTAKAPRVWQLLQTKRPGYDPKRDGSSDAMTLVDDVMALREVEAEMRAGTVSE